MEYKFIFLLILQVRHIENNEFRKNAKGDSIMFASISAMREQYVRRYLFLKYDYDYLSLWKISDDSLTFERVKANV